MDSSKNKWPTNFLFDLQVKGAAMCIINLISMIVIVRFIRKRTFLTWQFIKNIYSI